MSDEQTWRGEYALRPFLVPIEEVQPHPRNPRQGDVGAMSLSLEKFGQYRPAVVQAGTGYIVAGSHMWRAARALGWTHLAVLLREMDDEEAASLMLADNRVADRGSYDQAALADLLQDLAATTGGLDPALGYDLDDLDALMADLDRSGPPAPPAPPREPAAAVPGSDEERSPAPAEGSGTPGPPAAVEAASWTCRIGAADRAALPEGADAPLRQAVAAAYRSLTGRAPDFIESGWGG